MTAKIKKGYFTLSDPRLSEFAQSIISSLTGNQHYPDAGNELEEVRKALHSFDNSLKVPSGERTGSDAFQKEENRNDLENKLDFLYNYIVYKGGKNLVMLSSSGFPLVKEQTKPKGNAQPKNFKVTGGDQAGTMLMQCRNVQGSETYFYEYKQMPDADMSDWQALANTNNSLLITNLSSGAKYSFRMAAVGPETGRGEWSEIITRFIP